VTIYSPKETHDDDDDDDRNLPSLKEVYVPVTATEI
jgi:hypothetical protein